MEARQRKKQPNSAPSGQPTKKQQQSANKQSKKSAKTDDSSTDIAPEPITIDDLKSLIGFGSFLIGFCLMIYSGYWFAVYVSTLHENQMWFTNIQEVEREISFRTESGLYYSYYKQLVNEKSFWKGNLRNSYS